MIGREEIVRRARACIGVRFRPQGRDPERGLDCVGLAGFAFGRADLPRDYPMRGGEGVAIAAVIDGFDLKRTDTGGPGRLLLIEAGPRQFHLAVSTMDGFVHADALLRRVVETPGSPVRPVLATWNERED